MTRVSQLASQLSADFPQFQFKKAARARWSPADATVFYAGSVAELFHELGHASLGHADFRADVELIHMELDAWLTAVTIAANYGVVITDEEVEAAMDDYRDWLHRRSLCPTCQMTGVQSAADLAYSCVNCGTRWTANDARKKELRRRKMTA